jgi:hypothetical protein
MRAALLIVLFACGSTPKPPPKVGCDSPEPGQAMTQEQCTCRGGNVTLAKGASVDLHCEMGEVELATVKLGIEGGWCCKAP